MSDVTPLPYLRYIRAMMNAPSGLFGPRADYVMVDDERTYKPGDQLEIEIGGGRYRVESISHTQDGTTYFRILETLRPPAMRAEFV